MSENQTVPLEDVLAFVCGALGQGESAERAIGFAAYWCSVEAEELRAFINETYPEGLKKERVAQMRWAAEEQALSEFVNNCVDDVATEHGTSFESICVAAQRIGGKNLDLGDHGKAINMMYDRYGYLQRKEAIPVQYKGLIPRSVSPLRGTWYYRDA